MKLNNHDLIKWKGGDCSLFFFLLCINRCLSELWFKKTEWDCGSLCVPLIRLQLASGSGSAANEKSEHLWNPSPSQGQILFLLSLLCSYFSSLITINLGRTHILLKICFWPEINSRVWLNKYLPVWVTKYRRIFPASVADPVCCTKVMDTTWIGP